MLDSHLSSRGKKLQYLVSWKDYRPKQNSLKPPKTLKNAPDVVKEFKNNDQKINIIIPPYKFKD